MERGAFAGAEAEDLAVNGAAVSAQDFTDIGHAVTGNAKRGDGVSFTIGELVVRHRDSFLAR